ncbi:D-sedoheptulose 7-phosphate isomerase [Fibrivirga algicola]|uniref:Phosphoheptose isomerase n=1 Tax=Fibrivirga algicola TaxID=2950420 RepID=A0ABX0QGB7_9BACT|nr:D-sedoheptulose 7-phosphate isomerase [Fibrivirga algicola]ARK10125.1 phosphoheptose isomerase [Fibrella sp. ES10-3-2-2]NID11435.1 D-sedoheptulose 7-phosphate isomerase [Fibrivirga algicola]
MNELIISELTEARSVLDTFMADPANVQAIADAASLMAKALKGGGKIISCGNGGSHCDAMHFAEELSGRYRGDRRSLAAIAVSDPSHMSCVSNDYGYDFVFSRFVEGLGNEGDVLMGISTSGNSANIIRAVEAARQKGMQVVLLTGKDGGKLANTADVEIRVPHFGFADRIQEVHIKVIHLFILLIERHLGLA